MSRLAFAEFDPAPPEWGMSWADRATVDDARDVLRRAASVARERAARLRHADTTCLYAEPSPGACLPIRCWAGLGYSCGGRHTDAVHCQHCLYPEISR